MTDFTKVSPASQPPTEFSAVPNYQVVVDPDMASIGESFTVDARKLGLPKETANISPSLDRNEVAARIKAASKLEGAPRVGTAVPTISGVDHSHPANPVPSSSVGPPAVKVFFDMTGLGSIAIKYHKVVNLDGFVVFVTDKRFSGPAEFYPYCQMRTTEAKKPVGMYVQGDDRLILLDPTIVPGFPLKFDCEPFEFCVIPVGSSKKLNSAMLKELGVVNFDGESNDGKESNDSGRFDARTEGRGESDREGAYESIEGGRGGVL